MVVDEFPFLCRGDIYDARGCGFDKSNPYKVRTESALSSLIKPLRFSVRVTWLKKLCRKI